MLNSIRHRADSRFECARTIASYLFYTANTTAGYHYARVYNLNHTT